MKNQIKNHPFLTAAIIGSFLVNLGVYMLNPLAAGWALIITGGIIVAIAGIMGAEETDKD